MRSSSCSGRASQHGAGPAQDKISRHGVLIAAVIVGPKEGNARARDAPLLRLPADPCPNMTSGMQGAELFAALRKPYGEMQLDVGFACDSIHLTFRVGSPGIFRATASHLQRHHMLHPTARMHDPAVMRRRLSPQSSCTRRKVLGFAAHHAGARRDLQGLTHLPIVQKTLRRGALSRCCVERYSGMEPPPQRACRQLDWEARCAA